AFVTPLAGKRGSHDVVPRDTRVNIVAVAALAIPVAVGIGGAVAADRPWPLIVGALVGLTLMQSPKVAKQWERAVVLRLGKYIGLRGPGLFWIVPFIDS